MSYTKITTEFYVPTTSISRVQDCLKDIVGAVEAHKGVGIGNGAPFVRIEGPYSDSVINGGQTNGKERSEDSNGGRGGRVEQRRPGNGDEDLARDGDGDAERTADVRAGDGDDKPKRGRGRPRKSDGDAPEAGSAGRQRGDGKPSSGDAEDARGDEPVRTRKGSDEGTRQGEGRSGSSGRGRDDQRGNREASRVTEDDAGDDWSDDTGGDEWSDDEEDPELVAARSPGDTNWPDELTPETLDKTVLSTLLGEHFKATGGKDRAPTFELMQEVTGVRQISQIHEDDYEKLAKALLKDAAKYKFGIKKPK